MMLKMFKKQNRKGFTLIELMIVVAIIGILAAIAIPNFLKFQAKSKQSEAKTNLKGVYTAETSFFGENNKYDTFDAVNWVPVGGKYIYGYTLTSALAATDASHKGLASITLGPMWTGTDPSTGLVSVTPNLADNTFTAGAAGVISTSGLSDCWTINDNNALILSQSGV
jgi:type IV pilus assembly protein PilA